MDMEIARVVNGLRYGGGRPSYVAPFSGRWFRPQTIALPLPVFCFVARIARRLKIRR